jgi:serine/threonine protein phosphatase PrpC
MCVTHKHAISSAEATACAKLCTTYRRHLTTTLLSLLLLLLLATQQLTHHAIDRARDEFVVLGSDGLWDYLTNEEAVAIVGRAAFERGDRDAACADLISEVLDKAARHHSIAGGSEGLKALPLGSKRRNKHDDITCVVLYLNDETAAVNGGSSSGATRRRALVANLQPDAAATATASDNNGGDAPAVRELSQ